MKLVIILITTLFFLGCEKDKTTDGTNEVTAEETADATEETTEASEVTTEVSSFTCSENLSFRSVKPIDSNGSFPCSSDASSQCLCEFYITQDGQETLISMPNTLRGGCVRLENAVLNKSTFPLNYITLSHQDKRKLHIGMDCSLSN